MGTKHYNWGAGLPACGAERGPGATVNAHAKVTCEQCKRWLLRNCKTCVAIERAQDNCFQKSSRVPE